METINNIELRDENIFPDETVLQKILGVSYETYKKLLELFHENDMIHEWRYYRDGKAWLCKVQKRKKTVVWMSAWTGYMQATVYFPEKHMERIQSLDLQEAVKKKIETTKQVGKSIPCIFELRDETILDDFQKVINLKMECK